MSKSTIVQVAKFAGVSVGTVSRVINNNSSVSPELRLAVENAIKELDYKPNIVARSMRKKDSDSSAGTGNVGLLFINCSQKMLEVSIIARIIHSIENELSSRGYNLIVANVTDSAELSKLVLEQKVQGLILHGDFSNDICDRLKSEFKIVVIGKAFSGLCVPCVNIDNFGAVIKAVEYLAGLGHKRVGFVSESRKHADFIERLHGYRMGIEMCGLDVDPELEFFRSLDVRTPEEPEISPPIMDECVDRIISLENPPTAIIVANDWQAAGLYKSLRNRGITVPGDISVVGFDDDRICEILDPQLTSLSFPSEQIAREAVDVLLSIVEGSSKTASVSKKILVESNLIMRSSCRAI